MSYVDKSIAVNFDFRPLSYWPEAFIATHHSENRQSDKGVAAHSPDALVNLERQQVRIRALSCVPPIGIKEDLPSLDDEEIEIARINLCSVLGDSISIRARQQENGYIGYRVVDEYENKYTAWFDESQHLLTLSELIEFINGSECDDMIEGGTGLLDVYWWMNLESSPEEAVAFASIHSVFYPELETYFDEYGERWIAERYDEQEDEDLLEEDNC